ncbi:hypothetical protein Patl1_27988 [Pistacia atlantica]|uniref:Uncharacterized protein n=1 Tax=Pistacia atlantica TaxID=434234 RepID=A0ACC1BFV6_9ROSI|nr:hypothetical protein Patl1_27988 [Pistacia atlantica]
MSLIMNSRKSPLVLCPPLMDKKNDDKGFIIFDTSTLKKQSNIPTEFIWPNGDLINTQQELNEPLIDLEGFMKGDERATAEAIELVRKACLEHGFFQVINHGVDASLINAAYEEIDSIFNLPLDKKLNIPRKPGQVFGYSGAHADRFSSKLPWKETFSVGYPYCENNSNPVVLDYFKSVLGEDFERTGWVYQRYCEAMKKLSNVIFELLAISLGIDQLHYRKFFEDGYSIMRCNYYPPCNNSSLTMGTGPHSDPTALTILHQDQVGGLEVFVNDKWQTVRPRQDALVINLGDTFMALSNGKYKSCLHRAVVHSDKERRSMVFFVCPKDDKKVRPPQDLVNKEGSRIYPDFTWSDLMGFTLKHYRPDAATLPAFVQWFISSKSSNF